MNKNATSPIEDLLEAVELLLELDLEDPENEAMAREVLWQLKKSGHEFIDFEDENSPEDEAGCACLACLHLSLMSALGLAGTFDFDEEFADLD